MKQLFALVLTLSFFMPFAYGQVVKGIVTDATTKEALPFVHIGVPNYNVGVISDDQGKFQIDLSQVTPKAELHFSIIGYQTTTFIIDQLDRGMLKVELSPIEYLLDQIVVRPLDQLKSEKFGRYKPSKTTTGQSGIKKFGFGGEWGLKISYTGQEYQIEDINFHTRFNTVDSVLFRLNVYEVENDLPGESLLEQEIFTTSYKRDKWITQNVADQMLVIDSDIIVTFELVQIWWSETGNNFLFYTHGKGYEEGKSYSRESSFDKWEVNKRPPLTIYVNGRILP